MSNEAAPRVRLSRDVDITKADPTCANCDGTGVVETVDMSGDPLVTDGAGSAVPVICRCVVRNGGVATDKFDAMALQLAADLTSGRFAEALAEDLRKMPDEHRARAVAMLGQRAQDETVDASVRTQITRALAALGN